MDKNHPLPPAPNYPLRSIVDRGMRELTPSAYFEDTVEYRKSKAKRRAKNKAARKARKKNRKK